MSSEHFQTNLNQRVVPALGKRSRLFLFNRQTIAEVTYSMCPNTFSLSVMFALSVMFGMDQRHHMDTFGCRRIIGRNPGRGLVVTVRVAA